MTKRPIGKADAIVANGSFAGFKQLGKGGRIVERGFIHLPVAGADRWSVAEAVYVKPDGTYTLRADGVQIGKVYKGYKKTCKVYFESERVRAV